MIRLDIGGDSSVDDAFRLQVPHLPEDWRSLEDEDDEYVTFDSDDSIEEPNFNTNPKRRVEYSFRVENEQPLSGLVIQSYN